MWAGGKIWWSFVSSPQCLLPTPAKSLPPLPLLLFRWMKLFCICIYMYFSLFNLAVICIFIFTTISIFLSEYFAISQLKANAISYKISVSFNKCFIFFYFQFQFKQGPAPSHLAITLPYASNGPGANNHFPTVPTYSCFFLQHARQKQLLILVVARL